FRLLRDLRKDGDPLRLHFSKSEGEQQIVRLAALAVPQLAGAKQREQRCVTRKHVEVPVRSRDLHLVDLLVHQRAIGGHDLALKMRWQCHATYAAVRACALAITSSMDPTM